MNINDLSAEELYQLAYEKERAEREERECAEKDSAFSITPKEDIFSLSDAREQIYDDLYGGYCGRNQMLLHIDAVANNIRPYFEKGKTYSCVEETEDEYVIKRNFSKNRVAKEYFNVVG